MEIDWQNAEVPVDDLPGVEDVSFRRHPKRYQNYRLVTAGIFLLFPIAAYTIFSVMTPGTWMIWAAIPLLAFIILIFAAVPIGYRKRAYALREHDISYKKGWIFNSMITLPFNRIQHTEVSQGPIERSFRLSTLKIYTAGGSSSDLAIPGLDPDEGQELREFISRKAALHD